MARVPCNADPRVFADPDVLDVHRHADRRHLAFGHGIHYCLGARLAKLECEIALTSLLGRFPGLALAVPAEQLTQDDSGLYRIPLLLAGPGGAHG